MAIPRPDVRPAMSRRAALRSAAALAIAAFPHERAAMAVGGRQPASRAVTRGPPPAIGEPLVLQQNPAARLLQGGGGMGVTAIDLLGARGLAGGAEHGLVCSMGYAGGGTIPDGLNNPANHDRIVANFTAAIPRPRRWACPT